MATIQSYVQPSRLYRYRTLEYYDREIAAIEQGYLFCAPFTALNDPMEGLFSSSRHLRETGRHREIRESILENKMQMGICSFSEVRSHELMWAHYADKFGGICISYNLSRLLQYLPKDVTFVRMFYNESEPTIHRTIKGPDFLAKRVLSYKNYRWLYEREWRMFAPQGKVHYRTALCVSRVYLGARIEASHQAEIVARLRSLKIASSKMTITKYSIGFEPNT